jgi:transposase
MAIPDEIRARIVGLSEGGKKGVEIAAIVGVPVRIVQRLVKNFRENGTYKSKTCAKKYGKKLSDRDVRGIKRVLQADRRITLSDITNMCPTKVCRNTIRKALHDSGIHSRIAVKKPFLTPRHMSQRLAFAQKYCRWSAEDWEQVVWTDESTFEVGKNSRQIHVWRTVSERYASSCIVPTFKSGRTSLMIWGAFSGGQKSQLVFMPKDRRSAKDFVEVVYNGELLHFMEKVPQGLLMEDGAPVHRSKLCEEWRQAHRLEKLNWPANSPDLNPIENLWKILKDAVQHGSICPKNTSDLRVVIAREWKIISGQKLLLLCHSMPTRLQAVIEASGGHTRW